MVAWVQIARKYCLDWLGWRRPRLLDPQLLGADGASLEVVFRCYLRVRVSIWNGSDSLDLGALLPSLWRDVGKPWLSSVNWHAVAVHSSVVSVMSKMRAAAQPAFGSGKVWLR